MINQWLDWFLLEKLASMEFLGGLGIIGIRYRSFSRSANGIHGKKVERNNATSSHVMFVV